MASQKKYTPKWKKKVKNSSVRRRSPNMQLASKKLQLLTNLTSLALFGVIAGTVSMVALFAFYSRELPNPDQLLERSDELSSKLYDRNGEPIFEVYGEKNRSLVKYEDVAPHLIEATLAVEDANFYKHQGFYFLGMVRAVKNTLTGQGLQGGSTLTQQVVKNSVLTQDRTITRKIKEFILALQLENKYSKEQILQMYINETPYGGQNYGVITAAKAYFDKHPRDLTLAESAYLAGLPQRPSYYSHFGSNPEAGLERKNYVLYLMNEKGWIGPDGARHYLDDDAYEAAKNEEIEFKRGQVHFSAPHFVFYVKDVLAEMFGEELVEQGGLEVTTTLDLELQEAAQDIVYDNVEAYSYLNVGNGALVAVEPSTGYILAMVGSKDYFGDPSPEGCTSGIPGEGGCVFDPNVNVTIAKRQPGSSIKPITYATMLSQGYPASFPLIDAQTTFPGASPDKPYIPENYDGEFRGPMTIRKSLANSLNIPAVKALSIVGIDNMLEQAEKMGISTLTDRNRYGLALTLGGGETKLLEMTGAFGAFANSGEFVKPFPVIEVKTSAGDILYQHKSVSDRVLDEEVAFLMSDILSDDGARSAVFGAGSLLNIPGHQVAVKTGTTDDLRDNYAIGYTRDIAVGVWVGNSNNERMSYVASGITGATPIWREFMIEFLNGKEQSKFDPPEGVKKLTVDELSGGLPYEGFSSRAEWFIEGTEPTTQSDWFQRLEICKIDGRLASGACRDADKTEEKTFVTVKAAKPEWQAAAEKWIGENFSDRDEFFAPTMVSALKFEDDGDVDDDTDPVVAFSNLKDGDSVPKEFRLKVEVSSPNDIDWVKIYLNGNEVTRDGSEPYGYNFSLEPGEYEFRAKARDDDDNEGDKSIRLKVVGY